MSVYMNQVMLLETRNMTFGQFDITPIQDNIITLINEQLQKYMTNKEIQYDLFGMPCVYINCDEAGGERHKALVLKNLNSLARKIFKFRWTHPKMKRDVQTAGTIICAYHDYIGSSQVAISLNPWAIPFLLYYGKGVGGTKYKKQIALSLRGDKAKRIYKILCSVHDMNNGVYDYPISQFKEDFQLGPSYTNTIIKNRILETAKKEINGNFADVWFEYKLITKYPQNNKRKPMADTIRFFVHTVRQGAKNNKEKEINTLYRWLIATLDKANVNAVDNIFNTIMQSDRKDEIIDRVIFWERQVLNGEKTTQHVKNCIKALLRDDYDFKV